MREFYFGNLRVQLLSGEIVRLEYATKGKFCNKPTVLCPDRDKFKDQTPYKTYGNYIIFGDYTLAIPDGARSLSGVKLLKDGVAVYTYKKSCGTTLPPAQKTPEVFAVADNPRITVPDGGYKYRGKIKNSGFKIEENTQDIYLLICGGNVRKLSRLMRELSGGGELPRISALGGWTACALPDAKELFNDCPQNLLIDGVDAADKASLAELKKVCNVAQSQGAVVAVNYCRCPEDTFAPAEVKEREAYICACLKNGASALCFDGCNDTEKYAATQTVVNYYKKTAGEKYPLRAQCLNDINLLKTDIGLLPYIYRLFYENYTLGEPVKKQLGREYVADKRAAKAINEYMIGNDFLVAEGENQQIYLPAGKWICSKSGKIYAGGKSVESGETTFIRQGALVPRSSGKELSELTYDYYPCKDADDGGYIYEDDGESEAYKHGNLRTCAYKAFFDPYVNAYKMELSAAKGVYKGCTERGLTINFHMLAGVGAVKKITVNGADVVYEKTAKSEQRPVSTLSFKLNAAVNKDYLIIFYL